MKKIILSLFLSIIWFIGFSNASNSFNCFLWNHYNWENPIEWYCSPSSVSVSSLSPDEDWYVRIINPNWFADITNYCDSNRSEYWVNSCTYEIWFYNCLWEYVDWEWNYSPCEPIDYYTCDYYFDSETSYICDGTLIDLNNYWDTIYYWVYNSDFSFCLDETCEEMFVPSTTMNISLSYEDIEPDEPDEPWTWWNENPPVIPDNPSDWWNWWNIVPDWSLVSVIVWVFSVFSELIPYVVYIWIWILLVTIWFYAIRRLVNWLSDKIHNNFKF